MVVVKSLRLAAVLTAALSLTACSQWMQADPARVYQLTPAQTQTHNRSYNVSLRVQSPVASDQLSSSRISYALDSHALSVYKGVRWSSPVPRLLRDYMVDALRSDGRIRHISRDDDPINADYTLITQLLAFQSEESDGGEKASAHIRAYMQVVDIRRQRILDGRYFDVKTPAQQPEVSDVVAAFNDAGNQFSQEVTDWVLDQIHQGRANAAPRVPNVSGKDLPSDDQSADSAIPAWNGAPVSTPSIVF